MVYIKRLSACLGLKLFFFVKCFLGMCFGVFLVVFDMFVGRFLNIIFSVFVF